MRNRKHAHLFVPVQRHLKSGIQLSPMASFHHPRPLLVLLLILLLLVILRGRYGPDHVELEHQVPITRQLYGNRLQDGPCHLETEKKKSQKPLPLARNRTKHRSNEEWILFHSFSRENCVLKNRPCREIDAIILESRALPTLRSAGNSAENALFRNAPAAPLESKLHDTYHERTALWKSETPPPGQHQLPRSSLTRDGVVGVVTQLAPEERLEYPCEDQHHRPQPPHFSELSELKSAVSMAGSHLSREKRVEEQVFLEGRQHYSPVEECTGSPRVVRVLLDYPALRAFSLACLNFVLSLLLVFALLCYVTNPPRG